MKIFIRNAIFFFLTAIVLFLTAACIDSDNSDEPGNVVIDNNGIAPLPVHFDALNVTGEQVWMPNYNTGKVSQMFLPFIGNRNIDVIVIEYLDVPPYSNFPSVGEGKIDKGILEFSVGQDKIESNLLDSDDLLKYYFNEWYVDVDNDGNIDLTIEPASVKGNIITLVSQYDSGDSGKKPIEGVIREGFSGTGISLTGDYIYYLYVDNDCTISAEKANKEDLEYTFNEFNISLKTGWNTICKSETYTVTGNSSYSITVLNPPIRWVMQKIK